MSDSFKSLGQSLDVLISKLGLQMKMKEQKVIQNWSNIVGPQIAKIAKPEKVYDKVLHLRVANISWRTELTFQKAVLLKQIENHVGKNVINDLRFF